MNWIDKIKELTTKQDKSPELKKGEIKQILIQAASEVLPDFEFLEYKNSCYSFQRLRQVNNLTVYEILHIIFTLKDKNFACSIASRLNPEYVFSNQYNIGLINPHKDLKVLRHNSGALNIEDAYYFHNGQVDTTIKTVKEIFGDFKNCGLPFLDKQAERLKSNSIVKRGFNFIEDLKTDKQRLKTEITDELNKGGLLLSSLKHPIYVDLKENLQSVSGQTKEDRQSIPKTAHELLEIYWTR
ncbi:hypothetical protein M0M57_14190 [Flavobacterium azooxidireducens]|uniref:Uncharacterized protein n=1 Tax=Flavobacterium azooxidireducens TaxID=1871076 RepID=A0ABY4KGB1_9FLAO|nr:hypothetical protein [Flavobacterium azooxidireducens]UPQ78758.1 hypothetical protein M0M57_14190 [Flavobacterium azooxidireducens]